ncbi:MAG: hypothetical protein B6V02_00110 [Thermoprotei archaeon ex4572_64]|nr:MAG: hypothetical protein B6V02_00110 [Thermoprotei archaeon ex4572_64]
MEYLRKVWYCIDLTKPIVTASVYYTWLLTYMIASRTLSFNLEKFLISSLVVILGISLGNALNNYFDRDIDSIMRRTCRRRVLARGLISLKLARIVIMIISALSISLVIYASIIYGVLNIILYAIALATYVLLYTIILKRRAWWSILIAAIAYSAVILHAWYAATGELSVIAYVISILGYVWVLSHLWAIALHFAEDYALANVPVLSVRFWNKPNIPTIALTTSTLCTGLLALTPALLNYITPLYIPAILIIVFSEIALLVKIFKCDWRYRRDLTYKIWKMTYPVLALTFTVMFIFMLIH